MVPLTNPEKPFERTISFWDDADLEDDSFRRYSFSASDEVIENDPAHYMHLTDSQDIHEFQVDNFCYEANSMPSIPHHRFNMLLARQGLRGKSLYEKRENASSLIFRGRISTFNYFKFIFISGTNNSVSIGCSRDARKVMAKKARKWNMQAGKITSN